ncbi:MAG: hypothetical protein COB09_18815 [Thalassobium sp.]|nr:MAG: hypothetical protein COB09_18815 [Thalassobium sp.]
MVSKIKPKIIHNDLIMQEFEVFLKEQVDVATINDETRNALQVAFFFGAFATAKYNMFTSYESQEQYAPVGKALADELILFGQQRGLLEAEMMEEPMIGTGDFSEIATLPTEDDAIYEICADGAPSYVLYNEEDDVYIFEVDGKALAKGREYIMEHFDAWRPCVENCQDAATLIPDGFKSIDSAPKDGTGITVITKIPEIGEQLLHFRAYYDRVKGHWMGVISGDTDRKVFPVAWKEIQH